MDFDVRISRYLGASPQIHPLSFIHPRSVLIGAVVVEALASIWPGAVLRGDINQIHIGEGSNVQDNAVVHVANDFPCTIGRHVTIGHGAVVHACNVEDQCLIGIHATILDGSIIGSGSLIAAGTLIPPSTHIPPKSLVMGVPGKVIRERTPEEIQSTIQLAIKYQLLAKAYSKKYMT
ncbi:MAG: gamma carbonic anhydrase family protein [Methylacidiphilales bacterium]|nr:gamma carbonic anhydrase family protein [Candidatus Methylacidiphilales bacterium]MDW8349326.1 gamma carbonic anhydrase family protein [Verrucomicrobiae bacterium]